MTRVNSLFAAIPLLARVSANNKKGDSSKNHLHAAKVPRTGLLQNITKGLSIIYIPLFHHLAVFDSAYLVVDEFG